MRKRYPASFKAIVALDAAKGIMPLSELASKHEVHTNQIRIWKKELLSEIPKIFSNKRLREEEKEEELKAKLYQEIGQLKVELDWLKKKSGIDR